MSEENAGVKPDHFGFLLVHNYSMIAFSSAIECLRMANRASGKTLYIWSIYSPDGQAIKASNGIEITPDFGIDSVADVSIFFVCGGIDISDSWNKSFQFALRKIAKRRIILGALCTGSYLLARAGLLDGYKCTIHWENIASVREEFPHAQFGGHHDRSRRHRVTSKKTPIDPFDSKSENRYQGCRSELECATCRPLAHVWLRPPLRYALGDTKT